MSFRTRRSVLRSAAGLPVAASLAGCTDGDGLFGAPGPGDGTPSAASAGIPGVEDGAIVDHHAFASAHDARLAARTGTLEWAVTILDRETGAAEHHTRATVRVEGDRVHAVAAGRMWWNPEIDRREFYTTEDATMFHRTRTDGEWKTSAIEPQETSFSKADFTGRKRLEVLEASRDGTVTVDGEPLARFDRTARSAEDKNVAWISTRALVDDGALTVGFTHSVDDLDQGTRLSEEWYATDLGATTVETPDWVAEYEE